MSTVYLDRPTIVYPESDGMPIADNTIQFRYIVTIQGNLDSLFRADPNVFVAGDHLWYPVENHPEVRVAPDVYVVFGRPKGDRGSYRQWMEGGIAPQVVFEVLSPKNTVAELGNKLDFYQRYGVEEYYIYDPDRGTLRGYLRQGTQLAEVPTMPGHTSPRLKVRFELANGALQLYGPDNRRFPTFVQLDEQRLAAERRAEQERERAEKLAALLREHGIEPPA
jgi:Uma2 family endonuclease